MSTPSDTNNDQVPAAASSAAEESDASAADASGLPAYMRDGNKTGEAAQEEKDLPLSPLPEEAGLHESPLPFSRDRQAEPPEKELPEPAGTLEQTIAVSPDGAVLFKADSAWTRDNADKEKQKEALDTTAGAATASAAPLPPAKGRQTGTPLGRAVQSGSPSGRIPSPDAAVPPGTTDEATGKTTGQGPRSPLPVFHRTHPVLSVPQAMPSSLCSRIFGVLAFFPLLPLTVILLLQVLFSLNARELWFPDEARYADILQNLLQQGKAIVLEMNGTAYAETPPLYFWFLRGLHAVLRTDGPMLFFTGTAISALLYLWASLGLGRFACRVDGRTNLAAGIILLSSVCFMGLVHAVGVDLLFASLVLCGQIALYRAFVNTGRATGGMIIAFVLAGLAVLVNGPPGLALPVGSIVLFALWRGNADQARCVLISAAALAFGLLPGLCGLPLLQAFGLLSEAGTLPQAWALSFLSLPLLALLALFRFAPSLRVCAILSLALMIAAFAFSGGIPELRQPVTHVLPAALAGLFLLWQATPQRLFRTDFFLGLVAGLLTVSLWLSAVYLETGNSEFLLGPLLQKQVLDRIAGGPAPDAPSFLLSRLPLLLLPWTLLILCLPWRRLLGRQMREGLAASRRPEKEGLAFLWCMLIASLAIMSCTGDNNPRHLLPALPALALLAGRAALALEGGRAVAFRLSMTALLFLGGIATVLVGLMFFDILPSPGFLGIHWTMPSHGGFFVAGAILLVAAALLWLGLCSSRPEGTLLALALTAACLGYPLGGLVAPSFDAVLSPKDQSLMLRAYVEKGYQPASFHIPDGLYNYYSGHRLTELKSLEEALPLAARSKFILALPASDLESWKNKPECLTEVHTQLLQRTRFLLLACPPVPDLRPAAVPYAPAPDIFSEIEKLMGITPDSGKSAPDAEPQSSPPPTKPAAESTVTATDSPAPTKPAAPNDSPEENPARPNGAPEATGPSAPPPPAAESTVPATDSPTPTKPAAPNDSTEENPARPNNAPEAAGQENRL